MFQKEGRHWGRDLVSFALIQLCAVILSMVLSRVNDDNNPFAMAIFILAVALTARVTNGYSWGITAALIGTFCVNYIFTYPFWVFDITYPGYPLTVAVMLIVSVLISALTTQIKREETLHLRMEREKMHANLLRAIAHDIRTPLASILGASSALCEQRLPEETQKTLLSGMHRDAQWLVRVTENLLSITRFSNEEISLKTEDEVLEEIIGSALLKYHQNGGKLPVHVDEAGGILMITVDAVLIEQVLINLFDNVSIHAKGATAIWLHITPEQDRVFLSVEDDGRGISAARLQQILEGNHPSGSAHSDNRRNMGIGLSVCRSIIQAHGGEMTLGVSSHGGMKVRFDLPGKEVEDVAESSQ